MIFHRENIGKRLDEKPHQIVFQILFTLEFHHSPHVFPCFHHRNFPATHQFPRLDSHPPTRRPESRWVPAKRGSEKTLGTFSRSLVSATWRFLPNSLTRRKTTGVLHHGKNHCICIYIYIYLFICIYIYIY